MNKYAIKTMNVIAREGLELMGDEYDVSADIAKPDGILVRSAKVDTDEYPGLLAVARAGSGVNNISVEKATEKGICVFNTPGANANAVVDLVFPMVGVWLRNIYEGIRFCQSLAGINPAEVNNEVEKRKAAFRGVEIAGKNLGVIGLGQIGVRLANGGVHRYMKVKGFDPRPAVENIHQLLPEVKLTKTLAQAVADADIISLHLPLNQSTQGLVNGEFLRMMKKDAILVNYARGPVVDEEAVLEALNAGHLQGYITDFPTPASIGHPKVLTTPHLGASTSESEENCAIMAVNELSSYLEYGNVVHSVNFPNVESIPSGKVKTRLIVINRDVPGMIAFASNVISSYNINIASYINESNGTIGYNVIDLESPSTSKLVKEIEHNENVIRTRQLQFS
ncbi:MAG: 3-phosphoglycerate dehydrogenase family protein [Desulfocapsaceae bacterium]|nr:3-phosphoglycerate dehydrogenase family protein [Desulfocapsaceae bacterium]